MLGVKTNIDHPTSNAEVLASDIASHNHFDGGRWKLGRSALGVNALENALLLFQPAASSLPRRRFSRNFLTRPPLRAPHIPTPIQKKPLENCEAGANHSVSGPAATSGSPTAVQGTLPNSGEWKTW